jgi:predicted Zn-dependent peptidase
MPKRKVQEVFAALIYGDQPAGWSITGEKDAVRTFGKDDFLKYRVERYVTPGTLVVVAGKFSEPAVIQKIKKEFGGLKKRIAPRKIKTKEAQKKAAIAVQFKDSGQSHLVIGFRAFDLFDKRRYIIEVLADILGGGMSSRLFKRVREELGAAYYVGADTDLSLDHGDFGISAGVEHGKTEVVIKTVLEECRRLRDELVPERELQRSKDHMIGNVILGLETSDELASFYGSQEILMKTIVSPEELIKRVNTVTAKDIRSVAKAIFKNDRLNFAIIGPHKNKKIFEKIIKI